MVYLAHVSKKFHTKDRHSILGEVTPLSEEEAIEIGYTPCKNCNPDFDNY